MDSIKNSSVMDEKNQTLSPLNEDVSLGELHPITPTPQQDRALTNKIDLKLTPILGLLYLICFLDRTNIANAKIAGLTTSLNMPATGYNTALWIFYIPFVLAEVPSNVIMSLPRIKPNLWLGAQTFILGMRFCCVVGLHQLNKTRSFGHVSRIDAFISWLARNKILDGYC